jgi:hypothetical protein
MTEAPSGVAHGTVSLSARRLSAFRARSVGRPAPHRFRELLSGLCTHAPERIVGQVGISRRCLGIFVSQKFADHRERCAAACEEARIRMPQVVKTYLMNLAVREDVRFEAGTIANAHPNLA